MTITILPGSYCGAAPPPAQAGLAWNLDPILLGVMLAMALTLGRRPFGPLAMLVLAVAFVSPLCAISAGLFSARVVHHVLLVAVAAPLLAAGMTRGVGHVGAHFATSSAVLWLWHLPAAYDLALSDMGVYWIMQVTLLGSAVLFWRSVMSQGASAQAMLWTLAGLIQMGMLGAVLTFAPEPLYAAHAIAPLAWGLTPLADQQLGGLIMWVPAMVPYAAMIALQARRGWRMAERA